MVEPQVLWGQIKILFSVIVLEESTIMFITTCASENKQETELQYITCFYK